MESSYGGGDMDFGDPVARCSGIPAVDMAAARPSRGGGAPVAAAGILDLVGPSWALEGRRVWYTATGWRGGPDKASCFGTMVVPRPVRWRRLDPFGLVSGREGGDPCTRSWMKFFKQIWVKTCSWLDAKGGDGGALRCRSLLEGITVEKF